MNISDEVRLLPIPFNPQRSLDIRTPRKAQPRKAPS